MKSRLQHWMFIQNKTWWRTSIRTYWTHIAQVSSLPIGAFTPSFLLLFLGFHLDHWLEQCSIWFHAGCFGENRLKTILDARLIIVLKDGRVAEQGNHEELMALDNGIYRREHLITFSFLFSIGCYQWSTKRLIFVNRRMNRYVANTIHSSGINRSNEVDVFEGRKKDEACKLLMSFVWRSFCFVWFHLFSNFSLDNGACK